MQPFHTLTARLIPVPHNDIDTDQIIPARYLKVTDKAGLAEGLFYGWRYRPDGAPNPEFSLNQAQYQGAQILVAGDNFGCGSSREHAPWALAAWGIRAVISTSFADIFRNNAYQNGLLPVIVDAATREELLDLAQGDPQAQVTINLAAQTLALPGERAVQFPIDPFNKTCLLDGVDSLGYLLKFEAQIARYEQSL